jgi:hypothetical protein
MSYEEMALALQAQHDALEAVVAYCEAPKRGSNVVGDIETDIDRHRYSSEYYLARIEQLASDALRDVARYLNTKGGE